MFVTVLWPFASVLTVTFVLFLFGGGERGRGEGKVLTD